MFLGLLNISFPTLLRSYWLIWSMTRRRVSSDLWFQIAGNTLRNCHLQIEVIPEIITLTDEWVMVRFPLWWAEIPCWNMAWQLTICPYCFLFFLPSLRSAGNSKDFPKLWRKSPLYPLNENVLKACHLEKL